MASKKDKIIDYIKNSNYNDKKILIEMYEKNKSEFDNDIIFDIIKIIIEEDSFGIHDETFLKQAKELFYLMNIDKNNQDDYRIFLNLFRSDIDIEFYKKISKMFNDKNNIVLLVDELKRLPYQDYVNKAVIDDICNYITLGRRYYVDEKAFLSSVTSLINKIIYKNNEYIPGLYDSDSIDIIVDNHLIQDKYLSGLSDPETIRYSLSLEEMNKKYDELKKEYNELLLDKEDIASSINNDNSLSELERTAIYIIEDIAKFIKNEGFKSSNLKKQNEIKKILKDKIVDILKGMDRTYLKEEEKIYFANYYMALYNNSVDVFKILKEKTLLNEYSLKYLNKEFINMFDRDTYLDLIEYRFDILERNIANGTISNLINILKINLEYEEPYNVVHNISNYAKEKHDKLIEIFGVDTVARCDESFVIDINKMSSNEWGYYKKLRDINSLFILDDGYINGILGDIKDVYLFEEFAFMDSNMKKQVYKLIYNVYYMYSRKDNIELFRNIIDYIIANNIDLYDDNVYFIRDSFQLLANPKFNISIDEYFNLNKLKQVQLCQEYWHYRNCTMSGSIPAKMKVKKIIKKEINRRL